MARCQGCWKAEPRTCGLLLVLQNLDSWFLELLDCFMFSMMSDLVSHCWGLMGRVHTASLYLLSCPHCGCLPTASCPQNICFWMQFSMTSCEMVFIHLFLCLPRLQQLDTSASRMCLTQWSPSCHWTCPCHLSFASHMLSVMHPMAWQMSSFLFLPSTWYRPNCQNLNTWDIFSKWLNKVSDQHISNIQTSN